MRHSLIKERVDSPKTRHWLLRKCGATLALALESEARGDCSEHEGKKGRGKTNRKERLERARPIPSARSQDQPARISGFPKRISF